MAETNKVKQVQWLALNQWSQEVRETQQSKGKPGKPDRYDGSGMGVTNQKGTHPHLGKIRKFDYN